MAGCARFTVTQIDQTPNQRTITTKISGTAWFSSAQTVSNIKALQTDKTQSFGGEALQQKGATNTVATLEALARVLQALRPTP